MFRLTFSLMFLLILAAACSPSQKQVDEAVRKEMDRRDDERKRVYGYMDEYLKGKNLPTQAGRPQPPPPADVQFQGPSIDEQLRNPAKVEIGSSPIKGPKGAKITVVVFSDFQCPFCSKVLPTIDNLTKKYRGKVSVVFKNQPLPFHPNAMIAAQAALAAHKQGKFWEFHDLLFQNQNQLDRENLIGFSQKLGLSKDRFVKDMDNPETIKQIQTESAWASENGLGGTPSFLINGVKVVGALPQNKFEEVIEAILKK